MKIIVEERAPFQVLVFPYHQVENEIEYAIFRRADSSADFWQAIAGGGDLGEKPIQAARRESFEEAGIPVESDFLNLDSMATIPVMGIMDCLYWGDDVLVVPEYAFGVEVANHEIILSAEHSEFIWADYTEAYRKLRFDSNRNALWELNRRLKKSGR